MDWKPDSKIRLPFLFVRIANLTKSRAHARATDNKARRFAFHLLF
jgi:hypothetical protein